MNFHENEEFADKDLLEIDIKPNFKIKNNKNTNEKNLNKLNDMSIRTEDLLDSDNSDKKY